MKIKRSRLLKYIVVLPLLGIVAFGVYVFEAHRLAVEGNNIFAYRCNNVNPPLIAYKNSFLKFANCINNPNQCSTDEGVNFFGDYETGLQAYVPEETKWLNMEQSYMNQWDFKLFAPSYFKQAGEYEFKMYEGYRDDAKYILALSDQSQDPAILNTKQQDARNQRNKYAQLYFDLFNKTVGTKIWIKPFWRVDAPTSCNEQNMTIPDTGGSINWEGKPSPSPIPYWPSELSG